MESAYRISAFESPEESASVLGEIRKRADELQLQISGEPYRRDLTYRGCITIVPHGDNRISWFLETAERGEMPGILEMLFRGIRMTDPDATLSKNMCAYHSAVLM